MTWQNTCLTFHPPSRFLLIPCYALCAPKLQEDSHGPYQLRDKIPFSMSTTAEAQRETPTCPRSHSKLVIEPVWTSTFPTCKFYASYKNLKGLKGAQRGSEGFLSHLGRMNKKTAPALFPSEPLLCTKHQLWRSQTTGHSHKASASGRFQIEGFLIDSTQRG